MENQAYVGAKPQTAWEKITKVVKERPWLFAGVVIFLIILALYWFEIYNPFSSVPFWGDGSDDSEVGVDADGNLSEDEIRKEVAALISEINS